MRVLAVIPARGGSKGVPRKNILPIQGKPVIAYSIEAARASQRITRCIVSTDDEEIAAVAKAHGGDVPFLRPAELATDTASSVSVALHALAFAEAVAGTSYDAFMLLQPTTPLRTGADIDGALAKLESSCTEAVIGIVTAGAAHPFYMYTLERDRLKPFMAETGRVTRRQDFPNVYLRNGAIYGVRRDILVMEQTFFPQDIVPYEMPPERSVNIDSYFDLELAEFLLGRQAK